MVLRLAAVTLIATALLPATTARAVSGTTAGMYVGEQVWGEPACGQPHVEVSTPTEYEAAHETGTFESGDPLAWADENRCTIVINRELAKIEIHTAAKRCHVIVHEWGHLTGHEHSENRRSVMYGEDLVGESVERVGKRSRWVAGGAFKPCVVMTDPRTQIG